MAFKMALWLCALLFIATVYNVVGAYDAMGGMDVQHKFEETGLLVSDTQSMIAPPPRKPLQIQELAAN